MNRRSTATQEAVLDILKSSDGALSHEMVVDKLSEDINRATVYRILNRFTEDGLLHRVVADNGRQYFALCTDCEIHRHTHDHVHFRCLSCDKMECLTGELHPTLPAGYRAVALHATVTGYCADCGVN